MNRKILPVLLLLIVTCFACRTDDSIFTPSNKITVKTELLTGKSWKLTAYTEAGLDALHTTYETCELDNIERFLVGGIYRVDEGLTTCEPGDPQIYVEGKWEVKGDKLILSDDSIDLMLQFTVLSLTATTLKYSIKNLFDGEIYTYTFTAQ
ncbi:MAG: hypothetical protein H7Y13_05990 [Sphingobacteriaceae bacterium]|nr:hypothetical protein [Sphingobacteriaceae bacterium]